MFGIGTTELIVMLVIASIMLRSSIEPRVPDLVDVLRRGFRVLFGIEDADHDDRFGITGDIAAALLVIALVTIAATVVVAMLTN
jgi:hypothetical protein